MKRNFMCQILRFVRIPCAGPRRQDTELREVQSVKAAEGPANRGYKPLMRNRSDKRSGVTLSSTNLLMDYRCEICRRSARELPRPHYLERVNRLGERPARFQCSQCLGGAAA